MSALAEVAAAGGRVWAEGDKLRYRLPKGRADLIETLRAHKADVLAELEKSREGLPPEIKRAYARCRRDLALHPEWHRVIHTIDPDASPVLLAVAVRGVGCACLRIERRTYAGREFELLELLHRTDMAEPATTEAA